MAATRRTRIPTRTTVTDENAPTTRSRTGTLPAKGALSAAPVKPAATRTVSSSVLGRRAVAKNVEADGKPTIAASRTTEVRSRAALGELTNKDGSNIGEKATLKGKIATAPVKAQATSTVTGRPIIARRATRTSLAAADNAIPEETVVGPSKPVQVRPRPQPRSRVSAKNVKEDIKRDVAPAKATSATVERARAGIKRTLTASNIPPVEAKEKPVKNEIKDVEPSSKRVRTSSPVHNEIDEAPVEIAKREEALPVENVDALEDEQLYEVEEEVVSASGRFRDLIQDIDADDADDPTMVVEYVQDIFNYMKELEITNLPNSDYMDAQPNLKWEMRSLLTDWLIEVHHKFRLLPETLFLAVNLVDRFLSARVVSLAKLQLVGLTCLFIAAKYEEVICPTVQNFLFMADGGYTDDEILSAEKYVLTTLEFDMSYPNPMHFLRRVSKAEGYDIQTRTLAKYLMEMSCVDHRFLPYGPSLLAAAGVYMARLVLDRPEWDPTLEFYSSYSEEEILPVAQLMLNYTIDPAFPSNESFYRKYSSRKYMKAAVFIRDWAVRMFPSQVAGTKESGSELYEMTLNRIRQAEMTPPSDF